MFMYVNVYVYIYIYMCLYTFVYSIYVHVCIHPPTFGSHGCNMVLPMHQDGGSHRWGEGRGLIPPRFIAGVTYKRQMVEKLCGKWSVEWKMFSIRKFLELFYIKTGGMFPKIGVLYYTHQNGWWK